MDFHSFKKNLLNQQWIEEAEYDNQDLAYQISFMIKKARLSKELTQKELAEKVGTKQESIARAESGNKLPSITFLIKIAKAFNSKLIMPIFDFLADDPDLDFYHVRTQSIHVGLESPQLDKVATTSIKPSNYCSGTASSQFIYHQ